MSMKDTKAAQARAKMKSTANDGKEKTFGSLYLKFESSVDCAFAAIVTFPEEEDFHRRRKLVEQANMPVMIRVPVEDKDEDRPPGKLVPATQFKKKMHRMI